MPMRLAWCISSLPLRRRCREMASERRDSARLWTGRRGRSVLGTPSHDASRRLCAGLFDEEDGPAGPVGAQLYSHEFYETELVARLCPQACRSRSPREIRPALASAEAITGLGTGHSGSYGRVPPFHGLMIVTEDLPDPDNQRVRARIASESDGCPASRCAMPCPQNTRR